MFKGVGVKHSNSTGYFIGDTLVAVIFATWMGALATAIGVDSAYLSVVAFILAIWFLQ